MGKRCVKVRRQLPIGSVSIFNLRTNILTDSFDGRLARVNAVVCIDNICPTNTSHEPE